MGTEQQGIDVAWPQGARYNWHQWAGKISFGMCKATEGTGTDPDFGNNWDAMWWLRPDHRLPRFAYGFFRAALDPVAQAAHLVATVRGHGLLPGDNFVADFEATGGDGLNDGTEPRLFAARAVTFLHHINEFAPGHRVLPYCNPSFAQAGNCAGLDKWYLWLADYGVSSPAVPAPWQQWTFWQNGDTPIDTDRFNGDEAALLAFTRMPDHR
jgi:GH25 family lysozyme M1 (1,4-beta-N-acetylmuramidase)